MREVSLRPSFWYTKVPEYDRRCVASYILRSHPRVSGDCACATVVARASAAPKARARITSCPSPARLLAPLGYRAHVGRHSLQGYPRREALVREQVVVGATGQGHQRGFYLLR